jgi:hypothetical protein
MSGSPREPSARQHSRQERGGSGQLGGHNEGIECCGHDDIPLGTHFRARVGGLGPQVEVQAMFCVSCLMKPEPAEGLESCLCRRPYDRGHAGIPPSCHFDVRR